MPKRPRLPTVTRGQQDGSLLHAAVKLRVQPDFFLPRPNLYPVCKGLMGQTVKVKQLWYYLFDSGFAGIRVCNILAE